MQPIKTFKDYSFCKNIRKLLYLWWQIVVDTSLPIHRSSPNTLFTKTCLKMVKSYKYLSIYLRSWQKPEGVNKAQMACIHWSSHKSNGKTTGNWQWTWPNINYMLDTHTQIEHRGMSMRACPRVSCLLPCMKKAEKKKSFHIIVVLIVTGIQHALRCYIIKQTVEPDGEVQLEVRCLCSNAYTDKAYGPKCKQISLLPRLSPDNPYSSHYLLRSSHMMFYNPRY